MSAKLWTENVDTHQAIPPRLSPHPRNEVLVFVSTICLSSNIPIKPPPNNSIHYPQKPIVTVHQLGRVGNQMWDYISVWASAKKTGRELYVPSSLIKELEKIFCNLPVLPLSYLAWCPVQEHPVAVTVDKVDDTNRSIKLPNYIQLPTYIARYWEQFDNFFGSRNIQYIKVKKNLTQCFKRQEEYYVCWCSCQKNRLHRIFEE